MSVVHALICAFACFSAVPMPQIAWSDKSMRYMMAAFPLVGGLVAGCYALWYQATTILGVGPFLRGAGYALIPLLVTGGIHMDGFADVVDAQSSHASPERKREIMKDPHTGAFASMAIAAYLLAAAGLASELDARLMPAFFCVPVLSRCLAAIAAVTWRPSSSTGMLASIQAAARTGTVYVCAGLIFVATAGAMVACAPVPSVVALAASGVVLWWVKRFSIRDFGGMSGDLVGFFIQATELAMLACIAFVGKVA